MNEKQIVITLPRLSLGRAWAWSRKWLLPNPGTLVLILVLALAAPTLARQMAAPATFSSVTTIPYQGRLADLNGNPVTDRVNMEFRLYDVPTGGTPLWEEFWTGGNAVNVSDGLFSVMLGSIETGLVEAVQGHDELYLGITVGTDSEMEPRVQLGSVPFSVWSLTVADDSITADKIATGAVGSDEIAAGAVGTEEIADGSITTAQVADGAITQVKAPTLLESSNGEGYEVYVGSATVSSTDDNNQAYITFGRTFSEVLAFIPINSNVYSHYGYVVGVANVSGSGGKVRFSAPAGEYVYHIQYIVIGK